MVVSAPTPAITVSAAGAAPETAAVAAPAGRSAFMAYMAPAGPSTSVPLAAQSESTDSAAAGADLQGWEADSKAGFHARASAQQRSPAAATHTASASWFRRSAPSSIGVAERWASAVSVHRKPRRGGGSDS
jgi:hypothetical protein